MDRAAGVGRSSSPKLDIGNGNDTVVAVSPGPLEATVRAAEVITNPTGCCTSCCVSLVRKKCCRVLSQIGGGLLMLAGVVAVVAASAFDKGVLLGIAGGVVFLCGLALVIYARSAEGEHEVLNKLATRFSNEVDELDAANELLRGQIQEIQGVVDRQTADLARSEANTARAEEIFSSQAVAVEQQLVAARNENNRLRGLLAEFAQTGVQLREATGEVRDAAVEVRGAAGDIQTERIEIARVRKAFEQLLKLQEENEQLKAQKAALEGRLAQLGQGAGLPQTD